MSTIVYQNLVSSCLPPPLNFCKKLAITDIDHPTNPEFGNWGFLQTVPKESGDYTNPWAKKSSFSTLSAKSLELCTENLGSETGSDIITDGAAAIFSSPSPPLISPSDNNCQQEVNPPKYPNRKEASNCRETKNFPPPLTTMSGASSLQVRRHRESGRLIIDAVETPFSISYLQAERSGGRLKLCFLTAETTTSADAGEEEDDEWGGETAAAEEEIEKARIEVRSELEKFHWLSRCKEEGAHGNKGLCSIWKPALWVAI